MTASKQIIEILDAIGDKLGIAIDWTSENVWPYLKDLMEKYVRYVVVNKIFLIITSILVFFAIGVFATKCTKQYQKALSSKQNNFFWSYDSTCCCVSPIDPDRPTLLGITFSVALGMIFMVVFIKSVARLIECFTIPELIVFDYIKDLLSTM